MTVQEVRRARIWISMRLLSPSSEAGIVPPGCIYDQKEHIGKGTQEKEHTEACLFHLAGMT